VTEKIRVVLAEDQRMVLDALATLLDLERDILVVARAQDGSQALDALREHKPDVFVTDIEMPEMTGLDVVRQMKSLCAARALIVTTFARAGYLRMGARGRSLWVRSKDAAGTRVGRHRATDPPRGPRDRR
jgi:two-component system, NarL family, response regulator DesR